MRARRRGRRRLARGRPLDAARMLSAQQPVDGFGRVAMDDQPVVLGDLDDGIEARLRLALADRLPRAAYPRLLVAEDHRLHAADEIRERRVHQQALERRAVRGADQLHAALGDRARGQRLRLGADLVDDDDLRHMVLDGLDHHALLSARVRHLHAPCAADCRVRDVAVAADLVRRVDDDHALAEVVREEARRLSPLRRLADSGTAEEQDASAALDEVLHQVDRAEDRAADPEGQTDDVALAVAYRRDSMQRAFDAGAVVGAELADGRDDVIDVGAGHCLVGEVDGAPREARLGQASEVHDDLEEPVGVERGQSLSERLGEGGEQQVQVVGERALRHRHVYWACGAKTVQAGRCTDVRAGRRLRARYRFTRPATTHVRYVLFRERLEGNGMAHDKNESQARGTAARSRTTLTRRSRAAAVLGAALLIASGASAADEDGPILIERQGSFAVGGTVVGDPAASSLHCDHGFVDYQIPPNARAVNLLMWHSASAAAWQNRWDGGEGFQSIFVRRGFPVYVWDGPRVGRANWGCAEIAYTPEPGRDQQNFDAWRLGPAYLEWFEGVQFPTDDPEAWNQATRARYHEFDTVENAQ